MHYYKNSKNAKEIYFMWSFDDNENQNNNSSEDNGNIYASYTDKSGGNFSEGSKNKKSGGPKKYLGLIIILCVAIVAGTLFAGYRMGLGKVSNNDGTTLVPSTTDPTDSTSAPDSTTAPNQTAPGAIGTGSLATEGKVEQIAEKCLNVTVIIETSTGAGSGVIYTADGYIVTNYHVVSADSTDIKVTLFSGETLPAKYIYGDESLDIAVIKIEKTGLMFAEICSDPVKYGEQVIVIGNALGNGLTLTSGYVSAPEREVTISNETMKLIQIDAAVNSGNSGGGLFNTAGQLVGIVNAKSSGTTSSGASIDATGFAIPISTVLRCINDLNEYGYVTGVARLGVTVSNYLEVGGYRISGYIVINGISENGSAARSGLQIGDILYKFEGTTLDSFATLKKMLTKYSIGDTVELTVLRPNEKTSTITNPTWYLRECEEITIKITFVEFNPNA